jgi:hypothetical protein
MKSAYTRYLEAEIVRTRLDRDSRIRDLVAEKLELVQKVDRLERALMPGYQRAFGPRINTGDLAPAVENWSQALEDHNKAQAKSEEEECQPSTKKDLSMEDMGKLARRALRLKVGQGS